MDETQAKLKSLVGTLVDDLSSLLLLPSFIHRIEIRQSLGFFPETGEVSNGFDE